MSTISKKFCHPTNKNQFVFITYEGAFNNFKVYSNGKQIGELSDSSELKEGAVFEMEDLGDIVIGTFKNSGGLHVRVDGIEFYAETPKADNHDLKSIANIFWALVGLSCLGSLFVMMVFGFDFSLPILQLQIGFDVVIIGIYTTTAILLNKGKAWAYFLGTGTFTLTTGLSLLSYSILGWGAGLVFAMVIRMAVLIYLWVQVKNIIRIIREGKAPDPSQDELLDTL